MPFQILKVRPFFAGSGKPLLSSGPHVLNSSTFSSTITRGRWPALNALAQRTTSHARPRTLFSTGLPPFALLKCLQSGENHASPTRRPPQTLRGSTFHTSSQ